MSKKGSQTATSTTTQAPTPEAAALYKKILEQAQGVAATPYTPYIGELVSGVNTQQQLGIGNINAAAGQAQPYIQDAAQMAQAAAGPISAEQIQKYVNPYTQNVVHATEAQFANQNAQQRQGVTGNAIAQGALGGNREAVAQAELANQQQLAQAPVIANLMSQGYSQGVSTALAEQQAQASGAQSLGNLGLAGQQAALAGAGAQLGAGGLQQQTQQALDAAQYQQFQNQQAYPFQTLQWLAGLGTGVGSQLGGTTTGTQTQPQPGWGQQLIGGLTAGAGLLGNIFSDKKVKENIRRVGKTNDGQSIYLYNYKGDLTPRIGLMAQDVEKVHPEAVTEVNGIKTVDYEEALKHAVRRARGGGIYRADGGTVWGPEPQMMVAGTPWSRAVGVAPKIEITHGHGAPAPMSMHAPTQQSTDFSKLAKNLGSLGSSIYNKIKSNKDSNFSDNQPAGPPLSLAPTTAPPTQGVAPNPMTSDQLPSIGQLAALSPDELSSNNAVFYRGGVVHGYADGGTPDDDALLSEGVVADHPDLDQPINTANLRPEDIAVNAQSQGVASPSIVPDVPLENKGVAPVTPVATEKLAGVAPKEGAPIGEEELKPDLVRAALTQGVRREEAPTGEAGAAAQGVAPAGPKLRRSLPPATPEDLKRAYSEQRLNSGPSSTLLNQIKSFEGFDPRAKWDYKQYTNGFGTKARYPGEVIDRATAQARLEAEVGKATNSVDSFAPNLPEGVRNALSSLTYNSGTKWMNSGLGAAIKAGDYAKAQQLFVQYNKAGGEVNPGLVKRRTAEAQWFSNPDAGAIATASNEGVTGGGANRAGVKVASNEGVASDALPPEAALLAAGAQSQGVAGPGPSAGPDEGRPGFLSNVDLSSSSKLWPALTAAGFSMMASRAPNIGAAIGEAGMTGMQTYAAEKETEQGQEMARDKLRHEQVQENLAMQRAMLPYTQLTLNEQLERSKPVKIATNALGDVFGIPDPKNPGKFIPLNQETGIPTVPGMAEKTSIDVSKMPPLEAKRFEGWVNSYGQPGAELLQSYPDDIKNTVSQILGGDISLKSMGYKDKTKYMNLATKIDPNFNPNTADMRVETRRMFMPDKLPGRQVGSMNTAVEHLNGIDDLYDKVKNGDIPTINSVMNAYKTATGQSAVTALDAVSSLAADEVMKSIVPGGGGVGEREALAAKFKSSSSPAQFHDATKAFREFAGEQLLTNKKMYKTNSGGLDDFENRYLRPGAAQVLKAREAAEQERYAPKGPSPAALPPIEQRKIGGTYQAPSGHLVTWDGKGLTPVSALSTAAPPTPFPPGAVEHLKQHPNLASKFDEMFNSPGAASKLLAGGS